MENWLSAAEIAEMALPGLPSRKFGVNKLAAREGWDQHPDFARPRGGQGGGFEYRIDLLPLPARLAYLARSAMDADSINTALGDAPDADGPVTAAAQTERDARIVLIEAFKRFQRHAGAEKVSSTEQFAMLWTAGEIEAPAWVRDCIPKLSARSLRRWLDAAEDGETNRLAVDRGAARRGKGVLDVAEDGAVKTFILAHFVRNVQVPVVALRKAVVVRFGEGVTVGGKLCPIPDVDQFQRVLKRWKAEHANELLLLTNPDAFKSRNRVSGSYLSSTTALNQLWQIDASPADVMCTDGRQTLYVCIDVWSRQMIVLVTKTPRAEAVGLLLKQAILEWGVPERIKTDNGSDFAARSTKRLFADLGIVYDPSDPYSPEQKGVVERAIGTLQRGFIATLPGFIGHSVADRKRIEGRKAFSQRLGADDASLYQLDMSAADLQDYATAWAGTTYGKGTTHSALGMTPFERAASWPHPIKRVDEGALLMLLAPVAGQDGLRTVGKQGLRIDGAHYIFSELPVGETVFVRMDPSDMGRAYVFDALGENFIGMAICPERAGIDPAAALAEAQARRKALTEAAAADLKKEVRAIKPRDMADAVRLHDDRKVGALVSFPRKQEAHTTPALDAAAMPTRGPHHIEPPPISAKAAAMLAEIEADIAGTPAPVTNVKPLRTSETPHQRYRRALDLEACRARGEVIGDEAAFWLGIYQQGREYRSMKMGDADLGEASA
jgi:putative transposase